MVIEEQKVNSPHDPIPTNSRELETCLHNADSVVKTVAAVLAYLNATKWSPVDRENCDRIRLSLAGALLNYIPARQAFVEIDPAGTLDGEMLGLTKFEADEWRGSPDRPLELEVEDIAEMIIRLFGNDPDEPKDSYLAKRLEKIRPYTAESRQKTQN